MVTRPLLGGVVAGVLAVLLGAGAAHAAPEAAPLLAFGPGEQTVYRVHYLGLTAGSAQITVGAPTKQWGKDVMPIVAVARTQGGLGVWPIQDKFVSYWDVGTGRTLGSDFFVDENKKRRRQRIKMGEDGKSAQVLKQKEGEEPRERTYDFGEATMDVASATFHLRNQVLEPGKVFEYPVFTGSKHFVMRATVEGREHIKTAQGPREVWRVRVGTSFSGNLSTKRDIVAYLSTDAAQVPLRIEADLALGTVVAELTDYKQGRSLALSHGASNVGG